MPISATYNFKYYMLTVEFIDRLANLFPIVFYMKGYVLMF